MFTKSLRDIEAYIDYLEKSWGRVSVDPDGLPEQLERKLKKFASNGAAGQERGVTEVFHGGRRIALISYPAESGSTAAVIPLGYMIEKLFDQYYESDPSLDAYGKSLAFIREHYTEAISSAEIAKSIGYSRSYFGYIFKKKHGVPVNKYILQLRLSKAAELLTGTAMSISDVAEKAGFDDPNYFSTVFKATFGQPPRLYRAKNQQIHQS